MLLMRHDDRATFGRALEDLDRRHRHAAGTIVEAFPQSQRPPGSCRAGSLCGIPYVASSTDRAYLDQRRERSADHRALQLPLTRWAKAAAWQRQKDHPFIPPSRYRRPSNFWHRLTGRKSLRPNIPQMVSEFLTLTATNENRRLNEISRLISPRDSCDGLKKPNRTASGKIASGHSQPGGDDASIGRRDPANQKTRSAGNVVVRRATLLPRSGLRALAHSPSGGTDPDRGVTNVAGIPRVCPDGCTGGSIQSCADRVTPGGNRHLRHASCLEGGLV